MIIMQDERKTSETNKISAIKKLEMIREEILKSNYLNFPEKLELLENAYQISSNAPLRIITRQDGKNISNVQEREHTLKMLGNEIVYGHKIAKKQFEFWKFQVVSTIVMLMVSISDGGLYEINKILK